MDMMFWKKKRRKKTPSLLWLLLLIPAGLVGYALRERPWRRSYKAVKTTHDWQEGRRKQGKTGGPEKPAGRSTGAEERAKEGSPESERVVRSEVRTRYEGKRSGKQLDSDEEQRQDNLEVIEGIGPKIASILRNHGFTTFRQLAGTSKERLEEILDDGGVRIGPPDTWPQQARLAANEDWEGLDDLKGRLHAGRPQ